MLPIKKIYIDSRHKTPDSVSDSNFKIELPYTLQMPDNAVFFVTDVCIPHVWKTIEEDVNDRLYFRYTSVELLGAPATSATSKNSVIKLPAGIYAKGDTLATAIQQALTQHTIGNIIWSVAYNESQYSITIACSGPRASFKFYTDNEIASLGASGAWVGGYSVDPNNPMTANDIVKVVVPMSESTNMTTDFVNLQSINNVYITSPNLGSFDTVAPFSNNVIKKVPVTVPYGYMIVDQIMSSEDALNCSRQTLKTLEFHIRDGRGRYINLHGMHITFSIVFNKVNMDL